MLDLKLKIFKWNDNTKSYYLEDYCTTIKLSNSFSQISSELSFSIPYATLSSSILAINVEMGDKISLMYRDDQIFSGKVIDTCLKGKDQELSVTAYDYCWWIVKSNITKNFNNISVWRALDEIYSFLGATYRIDDELADNGNIIIKSHLVKKKQASKVLNAIYNEVTKVNGVFYYLHTEGDGSTITITEADKYFSGLTIQPPTSLDKANGVLIDYEVNESMQNMITEVDFYKTTGEIYNNGSNYISLDADNMKRYGIIHEDIEIADDDTNAVKAFAEGNKLLREQGKPSEELIVTCFGDINYKVAHGVMVKIPNTNYYDIFMYITSSEWIWNKDGTFISNLTLSTSKNQNLEDWTSIEEKQDTTNTTGSTSSDLVNRIITELKKYLGVPYKWAGKSPADGGMDCSGYIAYVYNQFKSELDINGGELVSYTYTMLNQGKDVTSNFPSNLKEGDIIFPSDHHVVAYVGNGQIIEEPQTGDVCKISPIRWDSVLKVIRVIPDSAWSTTSSSSTASDSNGQYSSKLVEFTQSWEGFRDYVYDDGYGNKTIGYGTTAMSNANAIAKGSCSKPEATKWLKDEMDNIATQVTKACTNKGVTLNQFSFDCLCDLSYQCGYPTILTKDKKNIFSSLCSGDLDTAKTSIKSLSSERRNSARCDMLGGTYTLND